MDVNIFKVDKELTITAAAEKADITMGHKVEMHKR